MYGGLHSRSKGGRGLISIEDCVNGERENLASYALESNEKRIITATAELKLEKFINAQNKQERKSNQMEKENSSRTILERNRTH